MVWGCGFRVDLFGMGKVLGFICYMGLEEEKEKKYCVFYFKNELLLLCINWYILFNRLYVF